MPTAIQSGPSSTSIIQQPSQVLNQLAEIILNSYVQQINYAISRGHETVGIDLGLFPQYNIDTLLISIPIALVDVSKRIVKEDYEQQIAKNPQNQEQLYRFYLTLQDKAERLKPKYYFNNKPINQIKDINSYHLNKLVKIEGILVDKSAQQIQLKVAAYYCLNCKNYSTFLLNQDQQQISTVCKHCNKQALVLDTNMSEYTSYISLTIQQQQTSPLPVVIRATCSSLEANQLRVGDTVELLAVVRISKQVSTYLQTISVGKVTSKDREQDRIIEKDVENFKLNQIIPAEIQELIPDTDSPDDPKYIKLIKSIAPQIYGDSYDLVKETMFWQQCAQVPGSISLDQTNQKQQHQTQPIHICLMGPPGIAKSSLLQSTPNARYTSAKQATLPGLTAAITQQNGQTILQQGLIPQSSNHILLLDEVEKMTPEIYNGLTAAMARQKITIAKAGIFTELEANCSIFAAGNYGSEYFYNTKFYSLFDVVFQLVDKNDTESNQYLARLILRNQTLDVEAEIQQIDLQRYISLVQQITVSISDEAIQYLIDLYNRHLQLEPERWTAQNFYSIIKLSIARCKARFGQSVTVQDVKRVEFILENSTQKETTPQVQTHHILNQQEVRDKLLELLDKTEGNKMKIDEVAQILQVNNLRLQSILDEMQLENAVKIVGDQVQKI